MQSFPYLNSRTLRGDFGNILTTVHLIIFLYSGLQTSLDFSLKYFSLLLKKKLKIHSESG